MKLESDDHPLYVLALACGLGAGALGFQRAGFKICGAVDIDPAACRDFKAITGVEPTLADLETMTPAQLRASCSHRPDVVFTSSPCKGLSGCLPAAAAATAKYQAMNELAFRSIYLALEAFADDLPPLFLFENVPRIISRGADMLARIEALLRGYGYAVARSTHDCGKLGGLAQHRRRFLLVARRIATVPPFLYLPPTKRVRGIGEVLGAMPVPRPGSSEGGPMHRLPQLSVLNWVRLALIPAGGDWRDLPESVRLTDRPARQNGGFGVQDFDDPARSVLGHHEVRDTWGSVADPRVATIAARHDGTLGVESWDDAAHTVTGQHGRRG